MFTVVILIYHFNANYKLGYCSNGDIAVEFFFVVTGYLLASHVSRIQEGSKSWSWSEIADSTWMFINRKIRSFLRYYICAFSLKIIVRIVLIQRHSIPFVLKNLFKSIPTVTLTFMGLNNSSVALYVGNTWYLSAMLIAIFVLYPMLLKSFDFSTKIIFPLLSMFILDYLYETYDTVSTWNQWTGICQTGVLRAIAEIALGAFLFQVSIVLANKYRMRGENTVEVILLTLFKISCYLVFLFYAYGISFGKSFTIHALLFCSVGVTMSFSGIGYTLPDCRLTRYLGRISLPIFIFRGFIRWTIKDFMVARGGIAVSFVQFLVIICIAIILSMAFMHITDYVADKLKV